ncbi:hypothetical protein DBV05_g7774 [Lasiodiplodia theobromae]|uniref:60S ribosomal protein L41 n=1 Tax=Lasiodiplodia theobromae TaxID=45133 RepID=A0A5N5D8H1_9PEZI|nr:hypothetical protein DBV05_g7774 [Lasiodiplodia theobromae]
MAAFSNQARLDLVSTGNNLKQWESTIFALVLSVHTITKEHHGSNPQFVIVFEKSSLGVRAHHDSIKRLGSLEARLSNTQEHCGQLQTIFFPHQRTSSRQPVHLVIKMRAKWRKKRVRRLKRKRRKVRARSK